MCNTPRLVCFPRLLMSDQEEDTFYCLHCHRGNGNHWECSCMECRLFRNRIFIRCYRVLTKIYRLVSWLHHIKHKPLLLWIMGFLPALYCSWRFNHEQLHRVFYKDKNQALICYVESQSLFWDTMMWPVSLPLIYLAKKG